MSASATDSGRAPDGARDERDAARRRATRRTALELVAATLIVAVGVGLAAWWLIGLAHDLILRETERQLRAYALLAVGRIDGDDLAAVRSVEDQETLAFRRVHTQLTRIQASNPELRWVYTMRYTGHGDEWVFVVDAQPFALDFDGDGKIDKSERATRPGDPYSAGIWHDNLQLARQRSVVDLTPVDDPPWGVTVSAWVPIFDSRGQVQGVLGIDMMYDHILSKLDSITVGVIGMSVLIGFLLLYVFYLLRRRTWAYRRMLELQRQLIAVGSIYAKFVPERVRHELEAHPDGSSLERVERDVSVMFVDVAGYTRLSERLPGESIGELLERYFSRYLDVIHSLRGQVNETAGDGLMVIFEQSPPQGHALDAVRAAIEIQRVTETLNAELTGGEEPTLVNIGINSGLAHVGLNKFRSVTGERYTYTATGPTTNVAARVAGAAKKGDILLTEATAERIRATLEVERFGRRSLKNVGRPIMLYRPVGTQRSGQVDPAVSGELEMIES